MKSLDLWLVVHWSNEVSEKYGFRGWHRNAVSTFCYLFIRTTTPYLELGFLLSIYNDVIWFTHSNYIHSCLIRVNWIHTKKSKHKEKT